MRRFWDDAAGATTEEYSADWQPLGPIAARTATCT
jgi:hypothetical protein